MIRTKQTHVTGPMNKAEAQAVVYCVWNVERDAVKIGFTRSPRRRFAQLKTACADELIYWGHFPGGRIAEEVWHEAFAHKRMNGEWFDASDNIILQAFAEAALKAEGVI